MARCTPYSTDPAADPAANNVAHSALTQLLQLGQPGPQPSHVKGAVSCLVSLIAVRAQEILAWVATLLKLWQVQFPYKNTVGFLNDLGFKTGLGEPLFQLAEQQVLVESSCCCCWFLKRHQERSLGSG